MSALGDMTFVWPAMLWLLPALPVLALIYLRLLERSGRAALRFANLEAVGTAGARTGALRRHVPAMLLLLGASAMIFALARPQALIMLPSRLQTVILAMDISGSMRATDAQPNRLVAAQNAAKTFVADQPARVRIGVVSIAGTAALVQSPTDNRDDIVRAIDGFKLQRGTALGSGLVISLATLLPKANIDVQQIIGGRFRPAPAPGAGSKPEEGKSKAAQPGSEGSAAIVLLSDGQSNTGPDPMKAAQIAAEHGVRVFTVGIGTADGAVLSTEGLSMRVRLDEETLKQIATATGGEYFRAGNSADLKKIYRYLSAKLAVGKGQATEVTAVFVAIGAALAMLAALLSISWFNRIV